MWNKLSIFLVCFGFAQMLQGRKLAVQTNDSAVKDHVGSHEGFAQMLQGRKLAARTTFDGPGDTSPAKVHGGDLGEGAESCGCGGGEGRGTTREFGGSSGGGEVNEQEGQVDVGESSGCLTGGGGLLSLCGKGGLFLLMIFVLVCIGLCIWCYRSKS